MLMLTKLVILTGCGKKKKKEGGIKTSCTIRVGAKLYWCIEIKKKNALVSKYI